MVEIGPVVLEFFFFNFFNVFLLLRNYLPLEKVVALILNKLESASPRHAICQVLLILIGPVVLKKKKKKMLKVYEDNDYNDDDGQIVMRKAHLSLLLR